MKNLILTAFVFVLTCSVYAQSGSIQYINHVYYKNTPLEKIKTKLSVKVRGMGYGGANSYYEIKGDQSAINLPKSDSIYFTIKMDQSSIANLSLYKSEVSKNTRRIKVVEYRTFSGTNIGGNAISCNVIDLGEKTYKILPSNNLEDGEYMFIIQGLAGGFGEAFPFNVGKSAIESKKHNNKAKKDKRDDTYPN